MKVYLFVISFALLWLGSTLDLKAQFDRERFGKNRLQHKELDWYFYSSNNFEVYYYDGGRENARMAIDYLENQFERITQMVGYVAYTKPKVYIYNSREDWLQSNLDLNENNYTVSGQTYFSKLLAEVPYTGKWATFKEELVYRTSKIIIEEMLYGSTIADAFQSNLINSFPDWFIDGAALYLAKGWDREMDDFVRHYLKENEQPRLYKLNSEQAELVGQSIWNFIVERYGKRYVSSILNLSRINRNEETSIANTLGKSFKEFIQQWRDYYVGLNENVLNTFESPDTEKIIASTSKGKPGAINDIKFSPDAKHLAYVENNNGKYKVKVRNLSTDREVTIYKGGHSSDDQEANFTSPVIAWRDTLNLTIATFKRGVTTLRMRSIDGSSQDKIFLRNITQVTSLDFAPNGTNMVLSAISNGRSDIYTLNIRGRGKKLTNDVFDNITPTFINDSTIVFASNKADLPDSVLTRTPDVRKLPEYFNLFRMDLGDSIVTSRLTNMNSVNYMPRVMNRNFVLHLSDQSGITNVMRLGLGSSVSSQVSAFDKSLESFDYAPSVNRWAYSYHDGIRSKLILEPYPNLDKFTPSIPRVQLEQAKKLNERISTRRIDNNAGEAPDEEKDQEKEASNTLPEEPVVQLDTLQPAAPQTGSINLDRLRFEREGGIDIENYQFDSVPEPVEEESLDNTTGRSDILDAFRQQSMQRRVTGPREYIPQFIANSLNTSFVVDPLRGFGISLNAKMTDLLDNHSFTGGLMTTMDFRSGSDIFFEYQYLKHRIDFRGRYDRKALVITEGDLTHQRYVLNKTELGISYPINVHSRVTLAPFFAKTQYFNLNSDSLIRGNGGIDNSFDVNYLGGKAEFVMDKTTLLGLYMEQGFKGKIGIIHYQGIDKSERSFSNAYLDLRNYQKIHKSITFATRLFAGSYFGNNPQRYLVGGMDNWLFNEFYQPPSNRPESSPIRNNDGVENSDILFAQFVDLRGYDYDEIRGKNVITFTAELRIPLFAYLSRGNIASNFIRNFQLVGFYDAGSSWDRSAPWERVNDQNTEVINTEGSPFKITLNNFNNPWLQSFGGGLRTVLLNYYVKFDVARPVRNYNVEETRFYVTLGYNF
ncbi:biopolymer transporter Tol [Echinicola jeungdonensis]|uniref:Biopolymer transporter Tol n=1 Tax=Echinicola jeungdonensis TaxID=709343 RepID=A0ABV5J5C4_9BACT|nr:biopolymer transporter Tol [Echinicola jeungdonensis]MDN3667919.1 biopolymer transporter Tol [Echinicola jeungdonensis]